MATCEETSGLDPNHEMVDSQKDTSTLKSLDPDHEVVECHEVTTCLELVCKACEDATGEILEGVGLCLDCHEYLCQTCFDNHTRAKPCRTHQLIDKDEIVQLESKLTVKCSEHAEEMVKFYCILHEEVCCTTCLNINHHSCNEMHYLPHHTRELSYIHEYKQFESNMNTLAGMVKDVPENANQNYETLENSHAEVMRNVKELRKQYNAAWDEVEAKIAENADAIKKEESKKLEEIADKYKAELSMAQETVDRIEELQKTGQNCSLYIEMLKFRQNPFIYKLLQANKEQLEMKCHIEFTPNQKTLDMLKQPETIGALTQKTIGLFERPVHMQDIDIRLPTDSTNSLITASALLPAYQLVITDWANGNVKVVDGMIGKVTSQIKLSSSPWDITKVSYTRVAVTLPNEKKLAFLTVTKSKGYDLPFASSEMTVNSTQDVQGACWGVDHKDNRLAVSFCDPVMVQIRDLQGHVLHEIKTDKQGQAIFNYSQYLSFGGDLETLYVQNFNNHSIMSIKLDGTIIATYTDTDLKSPRKLMMDKRGRVYVCAENTNTVHQLSRDCKRVRLLLNENDGLHWPFTLSYSEVDKRLYVGMYNNKMRVFRADLATH